MQELEHILFLHEYRIYYCSHLISKLSHDYVFIKEHKKLKVDSTSF